MAQMQVKKIKSVQMSLFGKCLVLVAVVTAIVCGLLTWNTHTQLRSVADQGLRTLAHDAILGSSNENAGAIKFGKSDLIAASLAALQERSSGLLVAGAAFGGDLTALAQTEGADAGALADLAQAALRSGEISFDETGLSLAAPVRSNDAVIGAIVLRWTAAPLEADILAQELTNMAIGFGVYLVLIALSAVFLNRALRRPMGQIAAAMDGVAKADYDSEIPMIGRSDEVGKIAAALDVMRASLATAQMARKQREADALVQKDVVDHLSQGLRNLAAGDLVHRLPATFPAQYAQLKQDFDSAMETMMTAVGSVATSANQIGTRARDMSVQSEDLSQRTENQAATLEQTAAAMQELTTHVKTSAQSAKDVDQVVQIAESEAGQTAGIVQETVTAMQKIADFSEQISSIISVIDDIAFQTNLLALNAGVEAARAGESGRGFAVVASEVGALALRSSDAAREIKTLITGSAGQVSKGVVLVGKAGQALADIVDRVKEVSSLIGGIATSAHTQASSLNEINVGISQLDQVTQRNAGMVVDASAASEAMAQEAQHLISLVAKFQIALNDETIHGAGIFAPPPIRMSA